MIEPLFTVWTTSAVIAAVLAGFAIGAVLGIFPRMIGSTPTVVAPRRAGIVVALLMAWAGEAFWLGQATDSYLSADPGLPRVLSRAALWLLYASMVGVGVYAALRFRGLR